MPPVLPMIPATEPKSLAAPVLEVFASIQGEGAYVGEPQVFVRLFGCPFRCRWCDTPGSLELPGSVTASVRSAERGSHRREEGWASPFRAATWISAVEGGHERTVSITGGEPLQWPGFVRSLRRYVASRRVHLETAGGHPRALAHVLDSVDHVSLDLKLPEDLAPPVPLRPRELEHGIIGTLDPPPVGRVEWAEARAASLLLLRGKDACAKVPFSGDHPASCYTVLLDDVAGIVPELPVFLQPVTPMGGASAPSRELMEELVELGLARGLDVRLVPQVHKSLRLP